MLWDSFVQGRCSDPGGVAGDTKCTRERAGGGWDEMQDRDVSRL